MDYLNLERPVNMEPINENTRWFLDHIIEAFVGLVALMGTLLTYVWNQTNTAHESALREHKEASAKALAEHKALNERMHDDAKESNFKMHTDTKEELSLHREYFGKIFDKMELAQKEQREAFTQLSRDSEARHNRLWEKLDGKMDKK